MRRIIAAAREGKSILEFPVYDGSESGEKLYNTLTVIGRSRSRRATKPPDDAAAKIPELAKLTRWPVTISYFEQQGAKAEQTGEQTPVYSISFELYENGISRALVLDYSRFHHQRRDDVAGDEEGEALSVKPDVSRRPAPGPSPPRRGRISRAGGRPRARLRRRGGR